MAERTESSIVDQLLKNRGVTDRERFFRPDYARDSHDPFLLPGMDRAIRRIRSAIARRESIAIYADYDADGIPGGALLAKVLGYHTDRIQVYIPDREREGYGLHVSAIDELGRQNVSLIITVDLGITNRESVSYAASRSIDVIVTDHHVVDPDRIPTKAIAILHPGLPGSTYPFAGLAGGGVAWKLGQALSRALGTPISSELKWWIELPAMSTVCDMVPLVDENRMLVHYGLTVLRKTRSIGLAALIEASRLDPSTLTARSIGFQLGPRLNAPGRVDHANPVLELLLTDDPAEAKRLADTIEAQNLERRAVLERIVGEAVTQVEALGELPSALVLRGEQWNVGVIGLAASRLVERYHRPTILVGESANGLLKGSARSIPAFDILAALARHDQHLTSYGGHAQAAGLALKATEFRSFQSAIVADASSHLTADDLTPTLRIDARCSPTDLTSSLADTIATMEPFGVGNPRPTLLVEPLTVTAIRRMGVEGQHTKLSFQETEAHGILFRSGDRFARCRVGDQIAVAAAFEWNEWNGERRLQLVLVDWRPYQR